MENKKEKSMNLKVIIPVAVVIIVGIIVGVLFFGKEDGYRLIQVYQVDGTATIERENIGSMDAYENLNLLSGDWVKTLTESFLRLKLDEDKYALVEEDTVLEIYATGNESSSKTDIRLEKGAITVEVENKLNDESSFEVTTPNSVMAIRGTVFRITTGLDEAGNPITQITVFEGTVTVRKMNEDGTLSEETAIESGKEALIYKENEEEVLVILDEINTDEIPLEVLEFLGEVIDGGHEIIYTEEEIIELIEGKTNQEYTVTFMYNGSVFGTQEVKNGELASKPTLMPAPSGSWNYDFNMPITQDTVIEFVE